MAGGGTGTPNWFQCSACRKRKSTISYGAPGYAELVRNGMVGRVVLTGRTRPNQSRNRHVRISDTVRQYQCLDCGHVGWSNHKDLERKANLRVWDLICTITDACRQDGQAMYRPDGGTSHYIGEAACPEHLGQAIADGLRDWARQ
jgi:hypothetical protein